MKFEDFRLIKANFYINDGYDAKKNDEEICPEIYIDSDFNEKEHVLLVSFGVRQTSGNHAYFYELVGAGLFKIAELPEEKIIKQLSSINCPAIIFPYIRETLADLTRRAGFEPLHLDPINFIELAKQQDEKTKLVKKSPAKKVKAKAKKKLVSKKKSKAK
jgi:preprotein translocase subunit SecB